MIYICFYACDCAVGVLRLLLYSVHLYPHRWPLPSPICDIWRWISIESMSTTTGYYPDSTGWVGGGVQIINRGNTNWTFIGCKNRDRWPRSRVITSHPPRYLKSSTLILTLVPLLSQLLYKKYFDLFSGAHLVVLPGICRQGNGML